MTGLRMRIRDLPASALAGLDPVEDDFTEWVVDRALERGFHAVHYRKAASQRGFRTPVLGLVGGPDVLLAREGAVWLAELKRNKTYLDPAQKSWQDALGSHHLLWRPKDAVQIIEWMESA